MSRQTNEMLLISDLPTFSLTTESFRTLRTNTQLNGGAKQVRIVSVTSCLAGEGKSMTAANLAASYAQQGKRTLLIDANLRDPVLHKTFISPNRTGLSLYLTQPCSIDQVSLETRIADLFLIPAGPLLANHIELLSSPRFNELLQEALGQFDQIVIDTPPILPVTDAQIVSALCDGVLLVVKTGSVKPNELRHAKRMLEHAGANLLGVVLNGKKRTSRNMRVTGNAEAY